MSLPPNSICILFLERIALIRVMFIHFFYTPFCICSRTNRQVRSGWTSVCRHLAAKKDVYFRYCNISSVLGQMDMRAPGETGGILLNPDNSNRFESHDSTDGAKAQFKRRQPVQKNRKENRVGILTRPVHNWFFLDFLSSPCHRLVMARIKGSQTFAIDNNAGNCDK